jgi:hypothetical protein
MDADMSKVKKFVAHVGFLSDEYKRVFNATFNGKVNQHSPFSVALTFDKIG